MSLDRLLQRAAATPARLLLAGTNFPLLGAAAARLRAAGVPSVRVVGAGELRPDSHPALEAIADRLRDHAPERVRDAIDALDLAADPLRFAVGLCALGHADAVVAGPSVDHTPLVEATRWILGLDAAPEPLRSASWLLLQDGRLIGFAESSLTERLDLPTQQRLGRAMAELQARLESGLPQVALLPGFRGDENVLIFPDGIAGSLALRIACSLAGARVLGPLLLGPPFAVAGVFADGGEDELVGTAAATVLAAGRAGN